MRISIIGAGLGGLATSCLLASKGHNVTVFEKNGSVGGKMNEIHSQGFRFDTGPSLLTMPHLLQKLFRECGKELEDHLTLKPVSPICRYNFKDGTVFDCYEDRSKTMKVIKEIAPEDVQAYSDFLDYAESIYDKTADAFIYNPLYDLSDFRQVDLLSFFGIDAFTTVDKRVNSYFKSPYLRQFFKRFTTYNGSSPYQAPATLNVIPHVELNQGGYYVDGGIYQIAEKLYELATDLGVVFKFNEEIKEIQVEDSRAKGIVSGSGEYTCELLIANSDASETVRYLLPGDQISKRTRKKAEDTEPSCSGYVLFLGIDTIYPELVHHNIFFSEDYEHEFHQIFREQVMPDDPTIYIANTSCSNPEDAPENSSNLFILVNAPYLTDEYNRNENKEEYAEKIISELEERGLSDLRDHIVYRESITPEEFYDKYRSNKGSIYGTSSNDKFSAFVRPRNKFREIKGLYLVGGSTHPGGGIPLVIQSAFNAVELIKRYEG